MTKQEAYSIKIDGTEYKPFLFPDTDPYNICKQCDLKEWCRKASFANACQIMLEEEQHAWKKQ